MWGCAGIEAHPYCAHIWRLNMSTCMSISFDAIYKILQVHPKYAEHFCPDLGCAAMKTVVLYRVCEFVHEFRDRLN